MNKKVSTQQVIDAIIYLSYVKGYPPTFEEIGREVGIAKSGVKRHVDIATSKGAVVYRPRRARTLVVRR